jgi:O-antigen/teichoic acid export membrane protein
LNRIDNKFLIILDQAIISLSNFIIAILLIKYLGLKEFGFFSFFWILFQLLNSVQLSFIVSPMLSNAPKYKNENLDSYFGGVFIQQLLFSIIILIVIIFFFKLYQIFFSNYVTVGLYFPFSLLLIFSHFFQFSRRYLLNQNDVILIINVDLILYILIPLSIYVFKNYFFLNIELVIWIHSLAFFFGCFLLIKIIPNIKLSFKNLILSFNDNWNSGKWLLATCLTQWFSANFWIVNTGIILGPYYLGVIRACQTILGIFNPLFQSFESIYPKQTSEILFKKGKEKMHHNIIKNTLSIFIIILFFTLIIIFFSKEILKILFDLEMAKHYYVLNFLILLIPLRSVQYFYEYGLRSMSKSAPIFFAYSISSVFGLILSTYTITNLGLSGFILGMYLSTIIIILIIYTGYRFFYKNYK